MEQLIFLTLSLTRGGAERVICNMCNEYFGTRYRVTIIGLMAADAEYTLNENIRFIRLDTDEKQYRQNLAVRYLRRRKALKRVLKQLEAEKEPIRALISFLPEPNLLISGLAHRCNYPIWLSVRNDPEKEYASFVRRSLMKLLYKRADGYVFQTEQAKAYFRFSKHITARAAVIPNPIAREFLNVPRAEIRRKEIVTAGRLEKQKAPLLLLRAFSRIHADFPDYRLLYYGEGSMRTVLEEEIRKNGLEGSVILKGNLQNIKEDIREAALFVLPSVYEGMPNALMEAMALGLPCIATDCPCGGPRFLIESGKNGLLVPVEEEEALAKAMRLLLTDEEQAAHMGEEAQAITQTLSPERIYREWDALISR